MARAAGGSDGFFAVAGGAAHRLRLGHRLTMEYRRDKDGPESAPARVVGPLGLGNKAGTWYLVAVTGSQPRAVFRVGRITSARVLAESFERPADFDLAGFWEHRPALIPRGMTGGDAGSSRMSTPGPAPGRGSRA